MELDEGTDGRMSPSYKRSSTLSFRPNRTDERPEPSRQSPTFSDPGRRWLNPTVHVLYTLSGTLGEDVGLVRFMS